MKVFIENEAGSTKKNLFNEKTLEYHKTVEVSRPYPYPYGFVIGTTSGDGDNLDCFVITQQSLKTGDVVEVEVIGMFEQTEDGKSDPKILARLLDENPLVTGEMEKRLRDFVQHVFDHLPNKTVTVGRFLGMEDAQLVLQACADKTNLNES